MKVLIKGRRSLASRRHVLAGLCVCLLLAEAVAVSPSFAPTVRAHCPNVPAQITVYGDQTPSGAANAIKAIIPWTDPNVCAESVSHSIDTSRDLGWVQVGWWKTSGSTVRGYCEVQNPTVPANYQFVDFAITAASHAYNWTLDTIDSFWDCSLDTSVKLSKAQSWVGMSSGSTIGVQGEAKGQHVQIGKMAPAALLISGMKYRQASSGTWLDVNVTTHTAPSPYGIAEPQVGQMQLWTNAH